MYAIIGGSGVYDPDMLSQLEERTVDTPFGSVDVVTGTYKGAEVAFLPRHGGGHSMPPHLINYRANMWSLYELGVERIVSTSAVGSLNEDVPPGSYVVLSNFLDFTKQRPTTFYEGPSSLVPEKEVVHIDVTYPYCPQLRSVAYDAGMRCGMRMIDGGTYVCTEGPRFETAAEIRMFSMLGGDVIGMTNVPEVVLARELEMCYSSIAMVTNFAAGISDEKLTHAEVLEIMGQNKKNIQHLFKEIIPSIPKSRDCGCASLLEGAKG
jgi:5'-methylthioadenosine phosphorylase